MTVVEQIYYQGEGAPHTRVGKCVQMLKGTGEVYERARLQATMEWADIDTGWVERVLAIRIENVGHQPLELAVLGCSFCTLVHGDFIRVSHPRKLQVRGETAYKLTVYPNA